MSTIEVKKSLKGKFRVVINGVQEGCELNSPILANTNALKLKDRYPTATLFLFVIPDKKS